MSKSKLTQANAVIIAAVITALGGGIFAIQAAIQPKKLEISATQTAEAKLTPALVSGSPSIILSPSSPTFMNPPIIDDLETIKLGVTPEKYIRGDKDVAPKFFGIMNFFTIINMSDYENAYIYYVSKGFRNEVNFDDFKREWVAFKVQIDEFYECGEHTPYFLSEAKLTYFDKSTGQVSYGSQYLAFLFTRDEEIERIYSIKLPSVGCKYIDINPRPFFP